MDRILEFTQLVQHADDSELPEDLKKAGVTTPSRVTIHVPWTNVSITYTSAPDANGHLRHVLEEIIPSLAEAELLDREI